VNAVRGLTKSCGHRMPASSTRCFAKRSLAVMPPGLAQALGPVLEQIATMTMKIKQYDRQIQELGQAKYPETQALLKVHGVGHITAQGTLQAKPRCWLLSRSPTSTQSVRRPRSSAWHHQGRKRLPAKSVDRVFQPYPASAWSGLIASTVGTPSGFARRQAGKEQGGCRGGEEVGCISPSHLDDARAVHALLRTSCLRNDDVHPLRRHRVPMTASAFWS
jgi:hypothetical protein